MRIMKTLITAAVATTLAGSAIAGGFSDEVIEAPIIIIDEPVQDRGSLPGWVIPVVIGAALIALATSDSSDENNN